MFKWNDTLTLCWNNFHQIENDKKISMNCHWQWLFLAKDR